VTLHNVTAPAEGLEIELAPLPIVRGAIGFARGTACPFASVELQKPGAALAGPAATEDSDDSRTDLEADCRFELPVPEDTPSVMVVARGLGWYTEALVIVPPMGDPDPICLNPPCRADPLEGSGDLFVSVDLPAERAEREDGDRAQPQPEMVARRVQGVLRTAAGDAVDWIAIRCNGAGSERNLSGTHVFSIVCPREASTLEYQITDGGPWTAVSIPDRPDLALVEIAVGHI
jgi:hypothetical protein